MFGKIGVIAKSLQSMVYGDTIEELFRREDEAMRMLQDLKDNRVRNVNVRQSDITKLEEALHDISSRCFITLPVYTGGTLSNSYSESINSCLRKIGLTAFSSRLGSLLSLRKYCQAAVQSRKGYSAERGVLLDAVMQQEVIDIVSNGVLRHQAKQIEQIMEDCEKQKVKIVSQNDEGSAFVIQEVIEKKLSKQLSIRRDATREVKWEKEPGCPDKITCSCNALVYRGMPCRHIILVALAQIYKIPLSCFNKRFWYWQHREGEPDFAHRACSSPPFSQEDDFTPGHDQHSQDTANDEIEIIPESELHITEAHINAMYGSEEQIKLRGAIRSLEMTLLGEYLPLSNFAAALDMINSAHRTLKERIEELRKGREDARVVVPHPNQRVGKTSYKTRPLQVAQACADAMKRNRSSASAQNVSPPTKRARHPSRK